MNSFSQKFLPTIVKNHGAFTLIEVMIAIAIISVGFVTLLGSQAKSISIATETQFILRATMLAEEKLAEFESGQRTFATDSGIFVNEVSGYNWQADIEEVTLEIPDLATSDNPKMIRLELSINRTETPLSYTVISYHYAQDERQE